MIEGLFALGAILAIGMIVYGVASGITDLLSMLLRRWRKAQ